jgi:alcohol dehydrogenase class IV
MLRAAYCAGVAFTQSYVGYVHGIAHSLGGQYGTPHGLANAVILPWFLEEYGSACHAKLGRLARESGVAPQTASDAEASQLFIQWVREMNDSMNIPRVLTGIREEDIPTMAAHAAAECNPLYPVPKLMDEKELAAMYYVISDLTVFVHPASASQTGAQAG